MFSKVKNLYSSKASDESGNAIQHSTHHHLHHELCKMTTVPTVALRPLTSMSHEVKKTKGVNTIGPSACRSNHVNHKSWTVA